ncbi:MAG: hypothetical protein ACBR12_19865 [Microcoleus sp.]
MKISLARNRFDFNFRCFFSKKWLKYLGFYGFWYPHLGISNANLSVLLYFLQLSIKCLPKNSQE